MDSYSVKEAATVLGVPVGRVWELLARGVIAGAQEAGSGMRVYLRGTPAAVPAPIPFAEPSAAAGAMGGTEGQKGRRNGGHDGSPDASPFRELLTEFRNLTERYGQALLALGEARGEVAGLRTRVELLEARLDLRLPGPPAWTTEEPEPRPPAPTAAPSTEPPAQDEPGEVSAEIQAAFAEEPEVAAPAPEAAVVDGTAAERAEAAAEPAIESVEPVVAEPVVASGEPAVAEPTKAPEAAPSDAPEPAAERRPPRRRRGSRSAVSGIAAALARADDPTIAGLPGGDEAEEALAALRRDLAGADAAPEATAEQELEPAQVDELARFDAAAPIPELAEHELAAVAPAPEVSEVAAPTVPQAVAVAPASTEPSGEAAPSVYSSEWDEPDWIAEEDLEQGWPTEHAGDAVAETVGADGGDMPDLAAPEAEPFTPVVVEVAEATENVSEPIAEEPIVEEVAEEPIVEEVVEEPIAEEVVEERIAEEPAAEEVDVASMAHWPLPTEDPEPAQVAELARVAEWPAVTEPAPAAEPEPLAQLAPPTEPEPLAQLAPPTEPAPAPELPAAAEQAESDAFEEELMWLGDEFRPSTTAWHPLGAEQREAPAGSEAPVPSTPRIEEVALERLARQRGWDETELSAIRSLLGDRAPMTPPGEHESAAPHGPMALSPAPPAEESSAATEADAWEHAPAAWVPPPEARPSLELPGAAELGEAMAALEVTAPRVQEPVASTPRAWSKAGDSAAAVEPAVEPLAEEPSPEPSDTDVAAEPPTPAVPAPSPSAVDELDETADGAAEEPSGMARASQDPPAEPSAPTHPSSPVVRPLPPRPVDEAWLRGRRGPAANAYRRLRRLFPG